MEYNWEEIKKKLDELKAKVDKGISQSTCPSCGHCPTCGRSNGWYTRPYYPYYPWWGQTWCGTSTLGQVQDSQTYSNSPGWGQALTGGTTLGTD